MRHEECVALQVLSEQFPHQMSTLTGIDRNWISALFGSPQVPCPCCNRFKSRSFIISTNVFFPNWQMSLPSSSVWFLCNERRHLAGDDGYSESRPFLMHCFSFSKTTCSTTAVRNLPYQPVTDSCLQLSFGYSESYGKIRTEKRQHF